MSGLEEMDIYQCPVCSNKTYYWTLEIDVGWLFSDDFLRISTVGSRYKSRLYLRRDKTLNDVIFVTCRSEPLKPPRHMFYTQDDVYKEILRRCWMAFNSGDVDIG